MITELTDNDFDEILSHIPGSGLPLKYHPNEMFHLNPHALDAWATWENEQYKRHLPEGAKRWSQRVSFVHRYLKLQKMRQIQPDFCIKSKRNYKKHQDKFKYVGTKYL